MKNRLFRAEGEIRGAEELNMTISRASHLESLQTFGSNQFKDEAYRASRREIKKLEAIKPCENLNFKFCWNSLKSFGNLGDQVGDF